MTPYRAAVSQGTHKIGVPVVSVEPEPFDFAVGFSRQPLPKGNRFAIVTNTDGPGVTATDAAICYGLDLTILRPETIESLQAKLPPTATLCRTAGTTHQLSVVPRDFSTAERARVGCQLITNGVKQELPGAWLFGVGIFQTHQPALPTEG